MPAPVSIDWVGPERFCMNVRGHQVPINGASWPGQHGATPSELLTGAVASAMLYCVEIYLRARGIDPTGLGARCEFEVSREAPLRILTISIRLTLPAVPAEIAAGCEDAARGSVLRATLSSVPEVLVSTTVADAVFSARPDRDHNAEINAVLISR